jgi:hypothetical protein
MAGIRLCLEGAILARRAIDLPGKPLPGGDPDRIKNLRQPQKSHKIIY